MLLRHVHLLPALIIHVPLLRLIYLGVSENSSAPILKFTVVQSGAILAGIVNPYVPIAVFEIMAEM